MNAVGTVLLIFRQCRLLTPPTPRLAWGLESDSLPNSGSGEKSRDRRMEQRFLLWFAGRSAPRQPPR
jgi:hypothetical protein